MKPMGRQDSLGNFVKHIYQQKDLVADLDPEVPSHFAGSQVFFLQIRACWVVKNKVGPQKSCNL